MDKLAGSQKTLGGGLRVIGANLSFGTVNSTGVLAANSENVPRYMERLCLKLAPMGLLGRVGGAY